MEALRCTAVVFAALAVCGCASTEGLLEEAAITTCLQDVPADSVLPEDFGESATYGALNLMPRLPDGTYDLSPGFYEMTCRSYCINAGRHGPGSGDGYAYAPLRGRAAPMVEAIIERSEKHEDIPQTDIQVLLWAIVAGVSLDGNSPSVLATAQSLLADSELEELNRGAQTARQQELLAEGIADYVGPLAETVIAMNESLAELYSRATSCYSEFESIALLPGVAPHTDVVIPEGRWCAHPGGCFVRYFPQSYDRTRVQVYVRPGPETATSSSHLSQGSAESSTSSGIRFNAAGDIAVPANAREQRLAQSNVPADDEPPCMDGISHSVDHVLQTDALLCWRAAFEMAFNSVPSMYGVEVWPDGGLVHHDDSDDNLQHFANENGLNFHAGATWTPEGMRELLESGPILVIGTWPPSKVSHAYVIGGVQQLDCDTYEFLIDVYDPLHEPDRGGVRFLDYADFIRDWPTASAAVLTR